MNAGRSAIPVNTPLLDGNERQYLLECIDSGWVSSEGPFVRRFEEAFAASVGRRYGVAVSSGSAALEAAVATLNLRPGDEVILPAFTIISCAAAIVRAGAVPVVVDADPVTWNMDVSQVAARITARTKAIMPVHIYGLPVDMAPLMDLAAAHELAIVEDAAEAHGLSYADRPCGSFGALSIFSFYANKPVTSGEGGMIVTDDPVLAERCRSLRDLCFQPSARFVHEDLGWNFRMSNLQAAVGLAQLESLPRHLEIKRRMGRYYREQLAGLAHVQLPASGTPHAENVYWVFGLVLGDAHPLTAADAMRRLAELGIGTRPFFWPMHEQPVFQRAGLFAGVACPVAERLARRGFYIPSGLGLTDDERALVVRAANDVLSFHP